MKFCCGQTQHCEPLADSWGENWNRTEILQVSNTKAAEGQSVGEKKGDTENPQQYGHALHHGQQWHHPVRWRTSAPDAAQVRSGLSLNCDTSTANMAVRDVGKSLEKSEAIFAKEIVQSKISYKQSGRKTKNTANQKYILEIFNK